MIKELLYIEDFASRQMFFRRLRVPLLVTVYWRHIVANHFMRKFALLCVQQSESR